jgi:hypothetical protein
VLRKKEDAEQQQQIQMVRKALNAAKDTCLFLNTRFDVTATDAAAAVEHAQHKINHVVSALMKETAADKGTIFQRLHGYLPARKKWKSTSTTLFGLKYLKHFLIMLTVKHSRDEVYMKTNLAEATYRVPGFSLCCVEGFCSIQTEKGTQKMVWSSGSIKWIHHSMELEMQEIYPMTLINEIHDRESVDGIEFDEEVVFRYIIEKFGLSEKAKHGTVEIALTINGAKLEGKFCYVMIGFKLVDVDAMNQNTGEKVKQNMQSDQWSFPLIAIVAKDTKSTYTKYVDHIFDFCNSVRVNGLVGSDGSQWQPFLIPEPQDMKSHKGCPGWDGAAKSPGVVHFCHLCMCTINKIALTNQVQCKTCNAVPTHICLHHNICGVAEAQRRREELATLEHMHLVTTIIQVCRDTVPIEYWDDPKKSPWEHLYGSMYLHLVPIGIAHGINDWMEDSRLYNLLLNETLGKFNLVVSHGMEPQSTRKELVGKILFFICRLKESHNALKF